MTQLMKILMVILILICIKYMNTQHFHDIYEEIEGVIRKLIS